MSKVTERAAALARPLCEQLGVYLWDVELLRDGGRTVLRFYIDREGGAGIDDCEALSRALDATGETDGLVEGAFSLEVSTPGMERTLRSPEHFERCAGMRVEVRLFSAEDGKKTWTGELLACPPGEIAIRTEQGEARSFSAQAVSRVRLSPDFSEYFKD